ncbi:hypothetical protein DRP05_07985 [Archaeoglobales archaeon]|mgnify:CR=1 FL=1|nr:MAG: hypothetical protein DRP05_07985 [Archaeoglobales archaeon]
MEVLFKTLYLVCFVCIGLGLVFVAVTTSSSEEPVKAGLKEVSVGDLIYFAKGDNGTVLVYDITIRQWVKRCFSASPFTMLTLNLLIISSRINLHFFLNIILPISEFTPNKVSQV